MIDFHTHILSEVDDGSRNLEESIDILKQQYALGIHKIMATPHFYPDDCVKEFVIRREHAMHTLQEALLEQEVLDMTLYKGAEVLISVDTWKLEDLEALCMGDTRYILIELPYTHWSEWVYTSLQNIIDNRKLIPIIAHVERYDTVRENPNVLQRFIEMGALLQVNAYSLSKGSSKEKLAHKLIKHHMIHLLGSDVHRAKAFISVKEGYEAIRLKHGEEQVDVMLQIGKCVCASEEIDVQPCKPFKKFLNKWI